MSFQANQSEIATAGAFFINATPPEAFRAGVAANLRQTLGATADPAFGQKASYEFDTPAGP